ncbi:sensor histidine kinase [Inquilinus sp. YAF38]|uniref:sensor histidine kinase n=1 Tax=Inquilinus sp. YAF38 TaxID=3233084 RepID=UPI003F93DC7D
MELSGDLMATHGAEFGSSVRRAALRLGLLYWLAVFATSSVLWGIVGTDPVDSAPGKLGLLSFSAMLTFGITALLFRLRRLGFFAKALLCFVLSMMAAPIYCLVDFGIYYLCLPAGQARFDAVDFGYNLVYGTSLFFGWSCLFVALLYSFEVRDRERRLAASREEALSAQMRALRYQVNPHFLFNTLNSIAGLIEEGAAPQAGRMVLSLSSFLRTTLALDPLHDVRLADELALQAGYLEIERERFSDRMAVRLDVAPGLDTALIPSLILQPLIENAVKHGVGGTPGRVEIVISADRSGQSLTLAVENDVAPAGQAEAHRTGNTGIGLRNVAARIEACFPGAGSCTAGHVAPGRFRAALIMPLRLA